MKLGRKNGAGIQFGAGLSGYVAELSSAILGAELGLPVAHLDSHASYIEHWLRLLKSDDRAILTAAAKGAALLMRLLPLGALRRRPADNPLPCWLGSPP